MLKWYRFLYWRALTWHRAWKGEEAPSSLWALVWLWILHVLNVASVVLAFLVVGEHHRAPAAGTFLGLRPMAWAAVVLMAVLWGGWLLGRRTRIEEEFRPREGVKFPNGPDVAFVVYNVVTLVGFLVTYIAAIADTAARSVPP